MIDSTDIIDAGGVSQYDALNRPMMWEETGAGDQWFARSWQQYDNLGRMTATWRDEQNGKGEWFGYDPTGQFTGVAYNADQVNSGTPLNASRTVSYTMTPDTLNRSSMNDSGDQSNYAPNALNQYENVAGGDLYYDGNFNLMWTGGFSAGYDSANHLTAIGSGEDYGEFTYDGLGRCLKRTIDWETTLITYDGWKPTVEWDEWNNLKAWNIYGPGPDEILYRHDAYLDVDLRYHLDRMGNVAFLLDGDGDGIEKYTYDAFGSPTVTDWNGENARPYSWYGNRFMFTGREYFPELGLYDYRNRFYHPVLGRFLQSDPVGFGGGDANLFRYCGGDPVNWTDPFGLQDPPIIPIKPLEAIPGFFIVKNDDADDDSDTSSPQSGTSGGPQGDVTGSTGPAGSIGGAPARSDTASSLGSLGNGLGLFSNDVSGSLPDAGRGAAGVPVPTRSLNSLTNPAVPVATGTMELVTARGATLAAGTLLSTFVIIGIDSAIQQHNAISTLAPGETAYIQTRFDMILGGIFLQQDIYTEIYVDPEGHVHTRWVTPGYGPTPNG